MKTIKNILFYILSIAIILSLVACKEEKEETKVIENKMSVDFVAADSVGLKQGGFDNSEILQKLIDEGKSIYLGDGDYYLSKTVKLKNAQIIGTASTRTSLYGDGDYTLIEADGQFVLSDMRLYNSSVDGSEKVGDKVLISLGQNGGAVEGSKIRCIEFKECGTAIYEAEDATASYGIDIDTIEYSKVSYAGMDFRSIGRKNNHIANIYMGSSGEKVTEFAEVGARFIGKEENLKIDQFNVEHFRAETSIWFDGISGLDVSTIHIEGMDIAKEGNGYIRCNNTSGRLGNLVVYWSRVSYNDCSLLLLGDAAKKGNELFIESIQLKGVNDPASFHGTWGTRGIKDNGYKVVNRVSGAKNEYSVELDNYVPFTWQNDWETLKAFPCDDENIVFIKKGNIAQYGTTEQRPTDCLCKNYSKYYDTTLGQLLVYDGNNWVSCTEE